MGGAGGKERDDDAVRGELWIMSNKAMKRFDGSFREYKKLVLKSVINGTDPSTI